MKVLALKTEWGEALPVQYTSAAPLPACGREAGPECGSDSASRFKTYSTSDAARTARPPDNDSTASVPRGSRGCVSF